jgi:hypothetical protein
MMTTTTTTTTTNRSARRLATGLMVFALVAAGCGGDEGDSTTAGATTTTTEAEAAATPEPADCAAQVDNPLDPLSNLRLKVFEGSERDQDTGETIETRGVARTQAEPANIAGYPVTVIEVREFEDGALVERTLDYYTQCDGDVYYVGEKVDDYEEGTIVGHEGQWQAGRDGAKPGLFMPAEPTVGQVFEQERAPGVAEDRSTVVALDVDVTVPAGRFTGCIKTEDFAPLDNITEFKFYCPDVGAVREERPGVRFDLVRYR